MTGSNLDDKQFEDLVHDLYAKMHQQDGGISSIEKRVRIDGVDGKREIDIFIRTRIGGHEIKTVIECKNWRRKIDVQVVDAFHSKIIDVRGNKGVIVSTNGFSDTARKKARRLGIDLCHITNSDRILEITAKAVPTIIYEVRVTHAEFSSLMNISSEEFSFERQQVSFEGMMDQNSTLLDIVKAAYNHVVTEQPRSFTNQVLFEEIGKCDIKIDPPIVTRTASGSYLEVHGVKFGISVRNMYGYVSEGQAVVRRIVYGDADSEAEQPIQLSTFHVSELGMSDLSQAATDAEFPFDIAKIVFAVHPEQAGYQFGFQFTVYPDGSLTATMAQVPH